ncbi:uncharacterized protein LOC106871839 isoform X1 [Octopus bimaculoides]|uniref:Uncharacterized protein n=1 Tax=Octopus bimaculoides TaxID=37653 RepID=A0A0L8HAN5_OCTBM|nr:uncharacterized protein LOC106871839 isoform X1 [Octopus bimaculoides]|eukprot:XP_014774042.1 PREDICTED: uncharacterized protein LOC106871839 isoform X1 [Octopus bimaculoides]
MSEIIDRPGFFARLRTGTQRCLHCIIPYLNRPKPKDDDASIDAGKPSSTIADMSSVATSEELGDLFDMDTSIKKLPFFDTPLIKTSVRSCSVMDIGIHEKYLPAVETVTRDVRFYDGTSIIELPSIGATLHNFYGIHGLTPPDVSPTNDTYTSNTGHGNRQWH